MLSLVERIKNAQIKRNTIASYISSFGAEEKVRGKKYDRWAGRKFWNMSNDQRSQVVSHMSLYGPTTDIRAVVEGNDCQRSILRSRYDGFRPVNKAISNINLFNSIALCMHIARLFYYLMHFQSPVNHYAMNDRTRKPLSAYD